MKIGYTECIHINIYISYKNSIYYIYIRTSILICVKGQGAGMPFFGQPFGNSKSKHKTPNE